VLRGRLVVAGILATCPVLNNPEEAGRERITFPALLLLTSWSLLDILEAGRGQIQFLRP